MNQVPCNNGENEPPPPAIQQSSPPATSYSAGASNSSSNDIIEAATELSTLQCKHLLKQQQLQHHKNHPSLGFGTATQPHHLHHPHQWMEVDTVRRAGATISYAEICSTAISIVMRAITVYINVKLATDYCRQGHQDYFIWTVICIVTPMCVTILIHANM